MDVEKILIAMGGDRTVRRLIDSSPSTISQMKARGSIPGHHVRLFIALRPELDWPDLLDADIARFSALINEDSIRRLRVARTRRKRGEAVILTPAALT